MRKVSSKLAKPRVSKWVVCEDIRREINHKNTLIGVFAGPLRVREFPAFLRVAIYMEVEGAKKGQKFQVKLQHGGNEPIMAEGEITVDEPLAPLALGGLAFNLPEPMDMTLDMSFDGETWERILTVPFIQADPSAFPQLS